MNNLSVLAHDYAITAHASTNHTYNGKPYSVHLAAVHRYACKYGYLIPIEDLEVVRAAAWLHDTIEDCRLTYNDIKTEFGEQVAELVYALTNEKGRTRKDRANDRYYEGIRSVPYAAYVKICDRLANAKYSKDTNSSMLTAYRKENEEFKKQLYVAAYDDMFLQLEEILK